MTCVSLQENIDKVSLLQNSSWKSYGMSIILNAQAALSLGLVYASPVVALVTFIAFTTLDVFTKSSTSIKICPIEGRWEIKKIVSREVLLGVTGIVLRIGLSVMSPYAFETQLIAIQLKETMRRSSILCTKLLAKALVIGPVFEELTFRGVVQAKLRQLQQRVMPQRVDSCSGKITRVAITSIAFGMTHYHSFQGLANIPIVCLTTLMGVCLSLYVEETDSIGPSIAHHFIHNTLAVTAIAVL